eukprot:TRINITY_DN2192_c0_g1_i1.p1 TRINITY_DN2192_c0_g1~~TRINITY_DN2192_c0_g1_i1.p1  ORF type:complete len:969 (-),score=316.48 TRINITY_DN2192_c0_g1_i1:220-3126(-)
MSNPESEALEEIDKLFKELVSISEQPYSFENDANINTISSNLSKRVSNLKSTTIAEESKTLVFLTRTVLRKCAEYSRSAKSNQDKEEFVRVTTNFGDEMAKITSALEEKSLKRPSRGPPSSNQNTMAMAKMIAGSIQMKKPGEAGTPPSSTTPPTTTVTATTSTSTAPSTEALPIRSTPLPASPFSEPIDNPESRIQKKLPPPPLPPPRESTVSSSPTMAGTPPNAKQDESEETESEEDMMSFLKTEPPKKPSTPSRSSYHSKVSPGIDSDSPTTSKKSTPYKPQREDDGMDMFDFLKTDPDEARKEVSTTPTTNAQDLQSKKSKKNLNGSLGDDPKPTKKASTENLKRKKSTTPLPTSVKANLNKQPTRPAPATPPSDEPSETEAEIEAISKGFTFHELIDKVLNSSISDGIQIEFLLTYRSICTSKELFNVIIEKFKANDATDVIKLRCLNLVKLWVDKQWSDFQKDKDELTSIFSEFATYVKTKEPKLVKITESIQEKFNKHDQNRMDVNVRAGAVIDPPILPPVGTPFSFQSLDALEIARQLTIIEQDLFLAINPWELLGQSWTKSNKEEISPNVCKFIDFFNKVNLWVQNEILSEVNMKNRTRVISKWLEVVEYLHELNNFNGIYEVISALQSTNVYRLTKTIQGLSNKKTVYFEKVKELMDVQKLRNALSTANMPAIPYLGMFLTDLIFLEDGNKNTTPDGKINFRKRQLIARTIRKIQSFQLERYPLQSSPEIKEWLFKLIPSLVSKEDVLYSFSLYYEPRAGAQQGEMPELLKTISEKRTNEQLNSSSSTPNSKGTVKLKKADVKGSKKLSNIAWTSKVKPPKIEEGTTLTSEQVIKIMEEHANQVNATLKQQRTSVTQVFDEVVGKLQSMREEIDVVLSDVNKIKQQMLSDIDGQSSANTAGLDLIKQTLQNTAFVTRQQHEKEMAELKAKIQELQSDRSSTLSDEADPNNNNNNNEEN